MRRACALSASCGLVHRLTDIDEWHECVANLVAPLILLAIRSVNGTFHSDPLSFSPPLPNEQEEQPAETGDSFGGFGAGDDAAVDAETDAVDDSDPFAFGDDDAATNDDGGGGDGNDGAEADDSDPFG